jgi:hypothetical protein
MPEWSQLLPAGAAPPEVEAAKREVEQLRAKVPAAREALTDAQAAVRVAEANDRQRMAEALRAGDAAKADTQSVQQAEQHVASVKREGEALLLAVADAERVLGEVALSNRERWRSDARRRETTARRRATKLLGELRDTVGSMAEAKETIFWLNGGIDRQQRAGTGTYLGELLGSAPRMANGSALSLIDTLGMLDATVAEPEPEPEPQAQPSEAAVVLGE